jgi:hypothetical protein
MMPAMARNLRLFLSAVLALAFFLALSLASTRTASAAPRWVDRSITLPRLVFAGDVGLGLAHLRRGGRDFTGAGMNLEAALGITDSVELGLRTGLRFGDDGKFLGADEYARTLFTETYGTGRGEAFANPEFHVRWAAYSGRVAEVGLDFRFFLPVEQNTDAGVMFGVPLAFHIADFMRIDTGIYIPVIFTGPASTVISVPAYFWFQPSNHVWLGPMIGLRHVDPGGPPPSRDEVLVGFGLGYQVASAVDLKWWILAPRINGNGNDPRPFGGGMGVQFRIGE